MSSAQTIREMLAYVLGTGVDDIDDDAPFGELGLDSIFRMELVKRINDDYGVELKADDLYDHDSVGCPVGARRRAGRCERDLQSRRAEAEPEPTAEPEPELAAGARAGPGVRQAESRDGVRRDGIRARRPSRTTSRSSSVR